MYTLFQYYVEIYMCVFRRMKFPSDEDVLIRAVFDEVSSREISLIKEKDLKRGGGAANASPRK